MQKLDVQHCTECKRIQLKRENGKWSGACFGSVELLRKTYEVNLITFTCSECETVGSIHHIACTAGAVH